MSDKLFRKLLAGAVIIGTLSAVLLTVYTYLLYRDCSIISYIADRG